MEYFIFLITIQLPFCYLVWKFFQGHETRTASNLRILNTQSERMTHMIDTLRLSIEKSADDLYRRVKKMETEQKLIKSRIYQIEKYTGLRSNINSPVEFPSSDSIQDKDFS